MNFAEVKQLLDAGFSAEEIRGILSPAADTPAENTVLTDPEPEQPEAGQDAPAADPDPEPWKDAIAALSKQMEALTREMQKAAIAQSNQPPVKKQTGEDILRSLL